MLLGLSSALVALVSIAGASSSSSDGTFVRHSRRSAHPDFVNSGPAPSSSLLDIHIGLVSKDAAGLQSKVYEISTPSSEAYGKHLSVEEVQSYLAPTQETVDSVQSWLAGHGVSAKSASPSGDWISIAVSVDQANKLFKASYDVFTHKHTGRSLTRTLSYSLPTNLSSHIDAVHPTTSFTLSLQPGPAVKAVPPPSDIETRDIPSACNPSGSDGITPACILALYGIPAAAVPTNQNSHRIAVAGFQDQWANHTDLKRFLVAYRPDMNPDTGFTSEIINNGTNYEASPSVETDMDVQQVVGIANGVPTHFISVGNSHAFSDFINGFVVLNSHLLSLSQDNRPKVLTISYGADENWVTDDLSDKICNGFAALGAVGTSVLIASGDGGVAGGHDGSTCTTFIPAWPAGCPFLTAVGATQDIPETAAPFSSGGFSNHFAQPDYQTKAVAAYISKIGDKYSGLYNKSGRAYPDVAAIGSDIPVKYLTNTFLNWGTSCSSPIFAAMIGLINSKLAAVGKPPLGFLNPFLYAHPEAFNDITSGNNPGCDTDGFDALAGWDPVTGLGTPKFPALLAAAGA